MVTDRQVRILMEQKNRNKTLRAAAAKAGLCEKTARKYLRSDRLPSQCKPEHTWKTHPDAFKENWPWFQEQLETTLGLEAKTLFEYLQQQKPGKYQDGHLLGPDDHCCGH